MRTISIFFCLLVIPFLGCSPENEPDLNNSETPLTGSNFPNAKIIGGKAGYPLLIQNGEKGYSFVYNTTVKVESLDSIVGNYDRNLLEIQFLGLWDGSSNSTNTFFNPETDRMYIHYASFTGTSSIFGNSLANEWNTTYDYDNESLKFTARSTGDYNDCWLNNAITIEFAGTYVESINSFSGKYHLTQNGEEGCFFECWGDMSVLLMG